MSQMSSLTSDLGGEGMQSMSHQLLGSEESQSTNHESDDGVRVFHLESGDKGLFFALIDGYKLPKSDVKAYYPECTGLTHLVNGATVAVRQSTDERYFLIPEGVSSLNVFIPSKYFQNIFIAFL